MFIVSLEYKAFGFKSCYLRNNCRINRQISFSIFIVNLIN
nr:MAG TPA: hypothetical protein [Bacteriophage sp.]